METTRHDLELEDDQQAEALAAVKASLLIVDSNAQSLTDSDYLRFLRARNFDKEKTVKLLVQHLKWRRSFVSSGYIKEEEIATELERKQIMLQGHDKFGCSIAIVLSARHVAFHRDFEEIKRLFVYCFDKAAASNLHPQTKFMIILDLEGWGLTNMDIRGYLAVLEILQNQFPERLRKLFILHVPYLFWGAWKVVSPFIDKVTREKIVFVDDKHLKETLLAEVEKDQLPTIYGGVQDLLPIQDCVVPNWPPSTIA
ncbi:hypothetical protein GOP47_0010070 [Adiantum capillus-veneris]|uniref:CRAL-TRIO domain-containing protein n=1 Tax=Adiantum capillus-veneris TaxID=13818 RepID=A0A9D4ZG21_ADICA|nr:hypothetical protein GOP47_0010070 [Adiantum capillus-veneris]